MRAIEKTLNGITLVAEKTARFSRLMAMIRAHFYTWAKRSVAYCAPVLLVAAKSFYHRRGESGSTLALTCDTVFTYLRISRIVRFVFEFGASFCVFCLRVKSAFELYFRRSVASFAPSFHFRLEFISSLS